MSDLRNTLQSLFDQSNRFANFGDLLVKMHVQGFRCHASTAIEFRSPVTAFCGNNGTGKSTLLQLAAVAYANPTPYYVKDFIVVGTLDPAPFTPTASVQFGFEQADRSVRSLTLSRSSQTKNWRGYKRRPTRAVLFAGVGLYLPRIEKRDFIVRKAAKITVTSSAPIAANAKEHVCRILGQSYDDISSNEVAYSTSTGIVVSVRRSGTAYSEAHMGYGEGRTQYLIQAIETLPERSLVVIEEPETSLHPSAQHELGKYLVRMSVEKRHQILLTTHSEHVLEALPSAARIYIHRHASSGIVPIVGLTALQAKSLMTDGNVKALCVLVEDECAKAVLQELIRRVNPLLLQSLGIHVGGDAGQIAKTVRTLRDSGLRVAAVRDGDQAATPAENIFKLPGSKPPEREIFDNADVGTYVQRTYGVSLTDFMTTLAGTDCHEWFDRLAARVSKDQAALVGELSAVYGRTLPETDISALSALLQEAMRT